MQRTRISILALLAAIALGAPAVAPAQQVARPNAGAAGEWRLIGQTHADHGNDRAAIIVKGPFDNIRKIEFWYDTKGFLRGKADVTVFGMK